MRAHEHDGFPAATLASEEIEATFVPGAGMVCCSLRRDGTELLDQRHGLRAYAERGRTMGAPLLYPWANRLAGFSYPGPQGRVELPEHGPLLSYDANGLPMHGILPGALRWELLDGGADRGADALHARLRWESEELLAVFPWRHELELRASVTGASLAIETRVRASEDGPRGDSALPVSFGFHPYLAPRGGERGEWELELPATRRLLLDERMIPTGTSEPFAERRFALEESDWDDAFTGLTAPPTFSLATPRERVELELLGGYSHAQLYAPAGDRFACFEPMTAPANALRSGEGVRRVAPGGSFLAAFAIRIA